MRLEPDAEGRSDGQVIFEGETRQWSGQDDASSAMRSGSHTGSRDGPMREALRCVAAAAMACSMRSWPAKPSVSEVPSSTRDGAGGDTSQDGRAVAGRNGVLNRADEGAAAARRTAGRA